MADTELEMKMDDFIRKNLGLERRIEYQDVKSKLWKKVVGDLDENTKYKLYVKVRNNGSETFVKNVNIRVVNCNVGRITFYKDDTYSVEVPRLDSPNYPGVLKPTPDGTTPGDATPWHIVPFMVKPGPDQRGPIAHVGIYAEIIPQGHSWSNILWYLD